MKSLFVGAIALALIAGAAIAEEAYNGAPNQTTRAVPAYKLPPKGSMDFAQRTVDPAIFDPSRPTPYHAESNKSANVQVSGNTARTEAAIPANDAVGYRKAATKTGQGN